VPAVKPVVLGLVLIKPDPPVVNVTLLVPPLHKIADAVALIVIGLGCVVVTVTLVVLVQPFASVAVNV
jgi:low affinity Fe/Cu permease